LAFAIFGGTFDPIHSAHLAIARHAAEKFGLDYVLLIPNGNPPHKPGARRTPFEHRYRMAELATEGDARLKVSRMEEGEARSYSILTIEKLKADHPGERILFLIGADAFSEIETWHRWRDVVRAVEFIVVSRPGHRYDVPEDARVHRLDDLDLPVSSSRIREELRRGGEPPELSAGVVRYIRENNLYR